MIFKIIKIILIYIYTLKFAVENFEEFGAFGSGNGDFHFVAHDQDAGAFIGLNKVEVDNVGAVYLEKRKIIYMVFKLTYLE